MSTPPDVVAPPPEATAATDAPVDLLTAELDDPVFKSSEAYKGGPAAKDIVARLDDDAKRHVHNLRVGYGKTTEEKAAAVRAKEEAEAKVTALESRLAEMEAKGKEPPQSDPTLALGDQRVRRLLGMEDGDFLEGVELPPDPFADFDAEAIIGTLDDDTMSDPAKMRSKLVDVLKAVSGKQSAVKDYANAVARKAAETAIRSTTEPYVKLHQEQQAATAKAALEQTLTTWRSANPGMDDDAALNAVLDVVEELGIQPDKTGKMRDLDAAYAVWARANPPAAKAPPPVVVAEPPAPTAPRDPLAAFRDLAIENQGRGSAGNDANAPRMPPGLSTEAQLKWLDAHPEARNRLRANPLTANI